jgi:hypothetical protein
MYEIKVSFETEQEMLAFSHKLELANNYPVFQAEFDNEIRSMIKHQEDAELVKKIGIQPSDESIE